MQEKKTSSYVAEAIKEMQMILDKHNADILSLFERKMVESFKNGLKVGQMPKKEGGFQNFKRY